MCCHYGGVDWFRTNIIKVAYYILQMSVVMLH